MAMQLELSKDFDKRYQKLNAKQAAKVSQALQTFLVDKYTPALRYHALSGKWAGHYSISAGGDLRIHLAYTDNPERVIVTAVGSHAQLYR